MEIGTKFKFNKDFFFTHAAAEPENLIGISFEVTSQHGNYFYCTGENGTYLISDLRKQRFNVDYL